MTQDKNNVRDRYVDKKMRFKKSSEYADRQAEI